MVQKFECVKRSKYDSILAQDREAVLKPCITCFDTGHFVENLFTP